MNCEWHQFYDISEVMWSIVPLDRYRNEQDKLTETINVLFKEEQLGFEMRDGKIEKVGYGIIDADIREARVL